MENDSEFNIRINIKDKVGIFRDTVAIFAQNKVDIVSVSQDITHKNYVPIEFVMHKASEMNIKKAL